MATQNYVTIERQVAEESKADYNYRELHSMMTISDQATENKVVIPYRSISAEYMIFLKDYIKEQELTEVQWQHFKHNPQALSETLYGTTKFWALLLEANHCKSRIEFTQRTVKYYDPNKLAEIINLILMKEEW